MALSFAAVRRAGQAVPARAIVVGAAQAGPAPLSSTVRGGDHLRLRISARLPALATW